MNERNDKIMDYCKELFAYPSKEDDDISLIEKTIYDSKFYELSIEGYIYYPTLQEGINYLEELKDKLYEYIISNYNVESMKHSSEFLDKNGTIYRTYDIEIINEYDEFLIFLNAPLFTCILDTYLWFDNVIKEIKKFNTEKEVY